MVETKNQMMHTSDKVQKKSFQPNISPILDENKLQLKSRSANIGDEINNIDARATKFLKSIEKWKGNGLSTSSSRTRGENLDNSSFHKSHSDDQKTNIPPMKSTSNYEYPTENKYEQKSTIRTSNICDAAMDVAGNNEVLVDQNTAIYKNKQFKKKSEPNRFMTRMSQHSNKSKTIHLSSINNINPSSEEMVLHPTSNIGLKMDTNGLIKTRQNSSISIMKNLTADVSQNLNDPLIDPLSSILDHLSINNRDSFPKQQQQGHSTPRSSTSNYFTASPNKTPGDSSTVHNRNILAPENGTNSLKNTQIFDVKNVKNPIGANQPSFTTQIQNSSNYVEVNKKNVKNNHNHPKNYHISSGVTTRKKSGKIGSSGTTSPSSSNRKARRSTITRGGNTRETGVSKKKPQHKGITSMSRGHSKTIGNKPRSPTKSKRTDGKSNNNKDNNDKHHLRDTVSLQTKSVKINIRIPSNISTATTSKNKTSTSSSKNKSSKTKPWKVVSQRIRSRSSSGTQVRMHSPATKKSSIPSLKTPNNPKKHAEAQDPSRDKSQLGSSPAWTSPSLNDAGVSNLMNVFGNRTSRLISGSMNATASTSAMLDGNSINSTTDRTPAKKRRRLSLEEHNETQEEHNERSKDSCVANNVSAAASTNGDSKFPLSDEYLKAYGWVKEMEINQRFKSELSLTKIKLEEKLNSERFTFEFRLKESQKKYELAKSSNSKALEAMRYGFESQISRLKDILKSEKDTSSKLQGQILSLKKHQAKLINTDKERKSLENKEMKDLTEHLSNCQAMLKRTECSLGNCVEENKKMKPQLKLLEKKVRDLDSRVIQLEETKRRAHRLIENQRKQIAILKEQASILEREVKRSQR